MSVHKRRATPGNQQRAVFGRAFASDPVLLLLDEPTRGVDVGAKAEIYELIDRAAEAGMAVLVASSELEELLLICHRIAVMSHGRIVELGGKPCKMNLRCRGNEGVLGRRRGWDRAVKHRGDHGCLCGRVGFPQPL